MGTDLKSWLHGWELNGQLANANSSKLPSDLGMQRIGIASSSPGVVKVSPDGTHPLVGFPELPNSKAVPAKQQPYGWFYCLPRFRKGLTSVQDMIGNEKFVQDTDLAEKFPATAFNSCDAPDFRSGSTAKQFLVFDQTGDKTTLIYSSGISAPVPCLTSWSPEPAAGRNVSREEMITRDVHYHAVPSLTDEDRKSIDGGEMHEDTEEINALLYSEDEDDCLEDDEEISTGHSPSTMTAYDKEDCFDEGREDVASSTRPTKRSKLLDGHYVIPSLMDTASSAKPEKLIAEDDDAESSSADETMRFGDMGQLSGNKRLRKERIRETVNILQSLIPDGKNKDFIVVLDEAIHYLRTLKLKAKSLGLLAL
ncbi:hypothetical protein Ancab_036493 [Ancistrocladus abbreviatus]